MILTGKAKSDFESWVCRPNDPGYVQQMHIDLMYGKTKTELYAYYIDFFDELGLWQETLDDMVCNVFDGESKKWIEIVERTLERANKFYNLTH